MMLKAPIQAAIFDLDGTLADTFPLIVAAWNAAVQGPLGRTYTPDEVVALFGIPDAAMLRRELQDLPEVSSDEVISTYYNHYETAHSLVTPFEGIPELLNTLHQQGIKMGVMTGKGQRTAEITIRQLGWSHLFGSVITGEDVTHQKPHPEGILKAAQELGVDPQHCFYTGDSPVDVQAGKAAGMFTIAAGWHAYYSEHLRALQLDYWAETPSDILEFLLSSINKL